MPATRAWAASCAMPRWERAAAHSASRRWLRPSTRRARDTWSTTPNVRYTGGVAADGSLLGWSEGASTAVAEPRLTERIVERALDTGARLTPIEGAASDVLRDAGGIAALLRW